MYNTNRHRIFPTRLVITNHRENYWLEDHIETYKRLQSIAKVRELTEKEAHIYAICFRALAEHHLENCH